MEHMSHGGDKNNKCLVCGNELTKAHKMEGEHMHTGMIEDLKKKRFIICIIITAYSSSITISSRSV